MTKTERCFTTVLALALGCTAALAQKTGKPLTNDDVISMVKKKLPESVIVSAIQTGPANFNTSTNELIRLNSAGVTEKELNAIVAASGNGAAKPSAPDSARNAEASDAPVSKSRMPHASVAQGNASQELKLEKTQLAETKTKPSSMKSLAGDSVVTQAMNSGLNTATYGMASHMN